MILRSLTVAVLAATSFAEGPPPAPVPAPAAPRPAAPSFSSVLPAIAFSDNNGFRFDLTGENFPKPEGANYLLEVGGRTIAPMDIKSGAGACDAAAKPCLAWAGPELLQITGIKRDDLYQAGADI